MLIQKYAMSGSKDGYRQGSRTPLKTINFAACILFPIQGEIFRGKKISESRSGSFGSLNITTQPQGRGFSPELKSKKYKCH